MKSVTILGKQYLLATLDFETYYGTGCTLTTLNTFEYVTHPEFSIHGVGLKINNGKAVWFDETDDALAARSPVPTPPRSRTTASSARASGTAPTYSACGSPSTSATSPWRRWPP